MPYLKQLEAESIFTMLGVAGMPIMELLNGDDFNLALDLLDYAGAQVQ
jgi:hypothetical protein